MKSMNSKNPSGRGGKHLTDDQMAEAVWMAMAYCERCHGLAMLYYRDGYGLEGMLFKNVATSDVLCLKCTGTLYWEDPKTRQFATNQPYGQPVIVRDHIRYEAILVKPGQRQRL